jgi:hypothetical protein
MTITGEGGGGDWFKILISVCHSIRCCGPEQGEVDNGCICSNSLMRHRVMGRGSGGGGSYCSALVTGYSNRKPGQYI